MVGWDIIKSDADAMAESVRGLPAGVYRAGKAACRYAYNAIDWSGYFGRHNKVDDLGHIAPDMPHPMWFPLIAEGAVAYAFGGPLAAGADVLLRLYHVSYEDRKVERALAKAQEKA